MGFLSTLLLLVIGFFIGKAVLSKIKDQSRKKINVPAGSIIQEQAHGWQAAVSGSGQTTWAGSESIINVRKAGNGDKRSPAGAWIFTLLALFFVGMPQDGRAGGAISGGVGVLLGICALIMWLIYLSAGSKFLGASWQLSTSDNGLTYNGGSSWSVSVDEIARVESGKTVEWELTREYGGKPLTIPESEMQVFIFTSDGRRLVVHTANAAREDCGRLAHSIRSYVETAKGSPSPADPSSPDNVPHGFDL